MEDKLDKYYAAYVINENGVIKWYSKITGNLICVMSRAYEYDYN